MATNTEIVPGEVERDRFVEDASGYRGQADRAFAPANIPEIQAIVRVAAEAKVPLTIAGAGTGLTGARVPHGGWSVGLTHFRDISIQAGVARAGAGALLQDVQRAALRTHQFFGPNPTESAASIGGIINTNASGSRSFRYGSVRNHVLALEVVLMDGTVRRFERGEPINFSIRPTRRSGVSKNSAGYLLQPGLTWVDLLCGSEGTLAIVTSADLQLLPEPAALLGAIIFFPDSERALDAVDAWRAVPAVRLLEYFDANSIELIRPRVDGIPLSAKAGLLIEQELGGDDDPELDRWSARLAEHGASEEDAWFGVTAQDRERFQQFRHVLPVMTLDRVRRNGFHKFGTDFAVPRERGRELLNFYRLRCEQKMQGKYVIYGHVGDANTHLNLFPESPSEVATCEKLMEELTAYTIALDGTVAAEHGIGKLKANLFRRMYSQDEIDAMFEVKKRLDPDLLLGRGTIFGPLP